MCKEKDSYRDCVHIHSYRHAPTHPHRQGKTTTDLRDLSAKLI